MEFEKIVKKENGTYGLYKIDENKKLVLDGLTGRSIIISKDGQETMTFLKTKELMGEDFHKSEIKKILSKSNNSIIDHLNNKVIKLEKVLLNKANINIKLNRNIMSEKVMELSSNVSDKITRITENRENIKKQKTKSLKI